MVVVVVIIVGIMDGLVVDIDVVVFFVAIVDNIYNHHPFAVCHVPTVVQTIKWEEQLLGLLSHVLI